ncbi:MAG: hypothetical protein HGGPFJEG_01347 [Ignavibacteria bacterium]|nr:hypothetical protein [Ignavibacteria bacterium]
MLLIELTKIKTLASNTFFNSVISNFRFDCQQNLSNLQTTTPLPSTLQGNG